MPLKPEIEQILEEYKQAAASMSFYNAAEGDWGKEANDRAGARARLGIAARAMDKAGIDKPKGYLI